MGEETELENLSKEIEHLCQQSDAAFERAIRSLEAVKALLADPAAMHASMLVGEIAKPSIENIIQLYGLGNLREAVAKKDEARAMTDSEKELIETGAEALWQAEQMRVQGKRRSVSWVNGVNEEHKKRYRETVVHQFSDIKAAGWAVEQGWQDIETARKKETSINKPILLGAWEAREGHAKVFHCQTGYYSEFTVTSARSSHRGKRIKMWKCGNNSLGFEPTHWRPLPASPAGRE